MENRATFDSYDGGIKIGRATIAELSMRLQRGMSGITLPKKPNDIDGMVPRAIPVKLNCGFQMKAWEGLRFVVPVD